MVNALRWLLKKLAELTIWRYRPGIIGVTGSVGKTSAKLAIKAVLEKERKVRTSRGNLNNDLGLSLTILGDWNESDLKLVSRDQAPHTARARKLFFWLKVITTSIFRIVFSSKASYPEILILEYGADRPGDLKYLLNIARPNISVITAIGDIPVHVEFFSGPDDVAREKSKLIEYLPAAGFAILNYDDESVMNLKDRTRAHVMTYGFGRGAELQITSFETKSENDRPVGISFKLEHGGRFVPVRLDGVFGKTQAYAAAAAASVGLIFGLNLVKISDNLKDYEPAKSRLELLPGIKYSYVIDDSYNASPLSMHAALDVLKSLPAKRKIAVLGDMLEIGRYTLEAHERVGRLAAKIVNVLVAVGPRAKFIVEAAKIAGMKKASVYIFETAEEAVEPMKELIRKGDLVLVKGSHAMELDKIVGEIRAF